MQLIPRCSYTCNHVLKWFLNSVLEWTICSMRKSAQWENPWPILCLGLRTSFSSANSHSLIYLNDKQFISAVEHNGNMPHKEHNHVKKFLCKKKKKKKEVFVQQGLVENLKSETYLSLLTTESLLEQPFYLLKATDKRCMFQPQARLLLCGDPADVQVEGMAWKEKTEICVVQYGSHWHICLLSIWNVVSAIYLKDKPMEIWVT